MAITIDEIINDASGELTRLAVERPKLHNDVAIRYALIDSIMQALTGMDAPAIISGYRSPQRNREVGGAPHSWHLVGRAIDLDNTNELALQHFGRLWELLGGRWGARFRQPDVNHFDVPGPAGRAWI